MKPSETIVTDYVDTCLICGHRPAEHGHHLICGSGKRKNGTKDKLKIPVCAECHNRIHSDGASMKLSKMVGQAIYEQTHTREEFRKRYGNSHF